MEKRIVERKTPAAGGRATNRKENPADGEIWEENDEFWRMYESVRSVAPKPRMDLRNPVLRSRAVKSPKVTTVIA